MSRLGWGSLFALAVFAGTAAGCGSPDSSKPDDNKPAAGAGTGGAAAEPTSPPAAPAAELAPVPDTPAAPAPLLWRVAGKGSESFLLGTMHLGVDPGTLQAPVWNALDRSKTLVIESDIAGGQADELQALARLEGGQTLDQLLSPTQWKTARQLLPDFPAEALKQFEPWFVSVQISARMLPPGEPMEAALARRAKAGGKQVAHLESWRSQIGAIEKATRVADLQALLDDQDKARADLQSMIASYKAGDEMAIRQLVDRAATDAGNPAAVEILIDDRNRTWMQALPGHVDQGGAFIAVGAAHLAGEGGLLALFEARGYRLERVPAGPAPSGEPAESAPLSPSPSPSGPSGTSGGTGIE